MGPSRERTVITLLRELLPRKNRAVFRFCPLTAVRKGRDDFRLEYRLGCVFVKAAVRELGSARDRLRGSSLGMCRAAPTSAARISVCSWA